MFRFNRINRCVGVASILTVCVSTLVAQDARSPLIEPTGSWGVGRATIEVVDPSRAIPNSRQPRRLMLHIWYPTATVGAVNLPYMEGLESAGGSLSNDELAVLKTVRTHSSTAPPVSLSSSRFPVSFLRTVICLLLLKSDPEPTSESFDAPMVYRGA